MNRRIKRLIRTVLVLILFLGLPSFLLHSNDLHRFLLQKAGLVIGWKIDFQRSHLVLHRGFFFLEQLVVVSAKQRFDFKADQLKVAISPRAFLTGKLVVSNLTLDHPSLVIRKSGESKGEKKVPKDFFKQLVRSYEGSLFLEKLALEEADLNHFRIQMDDQPPLTTEKVTLRLGATRRGLPALRLHLTGLNRDKPLLDSLSTKLTISAQGIKLSALEVKKGENILFLNGRWEGDLESSIVHLEGSFYPEKVLSEPLQFSLLGSLKKNTFLIDKLAAELEGGELTANGSYKISSADYHIDFAAKNVALESIFRKSASSVLGPSRGVGEVVGKAVGKLPQISVGGEARIVSFRHRGLAAHEAYGEINLNWPHLDFSAKIRPSEGGKESGLVEGGVSFLPSAEKKTLTTFTRQIKLRFEEAPLQPILPELPISSFVTGYLDIEGAGISVRGRGEVDLRTVILGPLYVESLKSSIHLEEGGGVTFSNIALAINDVETDSFPGNLRIDSKGGEVYLLGQLSPTLAFKATRSASTELWSIDSFYHRTPRGELTLKGQIDDNLSLQIKGPFDLKGLQLLRKYFGESGGYANLNFQLQGPITNPEWNGKILLDNGFLEVLGLRESLGELKGEIQMQNHTLSPSLQGKWGDGDFLLKGRMTVQNRAPQEYHLSLEGSGLSIRPSKDLRLAANCSLMLEGLATSPLLSGKIDVIDGQYSKKFDIHEFVLKPSSQDWSLKSPSSPLAPWRLYLALKTAGDFEIKNNLAWILLSSDLKIRGTYGSPQIGGSLNLLEGDFHYLGSEFALTQGRVDFTDPSRAEPYLLLLGERDIPPSYHVTMKIEGFVNNLKIDLTSSPARDREDILSLIAFGLTREELRRSGGVGQQVGLGFAWEQAARPLQGILSRTTGLDLQVEPSKTRGLATGRIAVIGDVTDRLNFTLKTDLAPETAERTLQANYYLTDNILLKGVRTRTATTAPRYRFNLSLRFRLQ
ncbi:MAG: translocation/assembly module TamB domain-containing protein [Deltaproteobacteria bacterium]|nr:translocation/assembly module TamB domain-containing protein [Deltaproteobacteria bacterium]